MIVLILCLPVYENHRHFLVWEHVVSANVSATALNRLPWYFSLFLFVYVNVCLPVIEKHNHFSGLKSHHRNLLFLIFCFVFSLVHYYYDVFLLFQTNIIITQDRINCIQNTKENWLVLFWSTPCQIMEVLRPKTGNPMEIWF